MLLKSSKVRSRDENQRNLFSDKCIGDEELSYLKEQYWRRKYGRRHSFRLKLFLFLLIGFSVLFTMSVVAVTIFLFWSTRNFIKFEN
uniref:Uncharacterized protein n=1 Tax=Schistosoma mansoni TaxID=6183 RepID=A0A5K4F749_SCHMA